MTGGLRWRMATAVVFILLVIVALREGDEETEERLVETSGKSQEHKQSSASTGAWREALDVEALLAMAERSPFASLCRGTASDPFLCGDVGKRARNASGPEEMREMDLGPIIGIVHRPKGTLISRLGEDPRVASRDGWYYIIGPGGVADYTFLRAVREISPKVPAE